MSAPAGVGGSLVIHESVVAKSAAQAASELPEVWAAGRGPLGLRRVDRNTRPRVEATLSGGTAALEVRLALPYPVPVREVTESARRHLSDRVELLTGIPVRRVDLQIERMGSPGRLGSRDGTEGRRLA
ncbi:MULTISPECIES: Asp23/Gls24 family envelope stress response protein [Nesterenkonia]|uniref:Putative alkaline shock family protein YloU n=1 Tax=Nesterenkonia xinjiangensis TaxID=225327 RepID=A0A7Z0K7Z1_9MICC|nr:MULTISPECIES: Asp23/Gls24 family envelope stress response protein [Nesterenkonia]MDZ5076968.1 Asp23/Gls24 family envelope stress response protein [Nesterenkonia sp. HG001]NYJ77029.1 putative alkaline shock family protein YloU [Nesterenkonia xinjiangensis]